MFFKTFNGHWRKKQIFNILSVFVFVVLLIFSIEKFDPVNILSPIVHFPKLLNKVNNNRNCTLHECTLEQKQKQGDVFASFDPVWSGCYGDFYLMAFDNYDTSVYTLIDVGSNKAYAVATWLSFFTPELKINQDNLFNYLNTLGKLTEVCGSCNDCKDQPLKRVNTNQKVILNIHAFEPQPDTVIVLNDVKVWMNISSRSNSTLNMYGMAASNYDGKASFKKCNPGNEVCSLDVSKPTDYKVEVDVTTLDRFADIHNLTTIDILKIDTEGYEPYVFQGAKRLFQQHRIRLFIFEHLKLAAWRNTSLQIEVSKLADLGYVCYIIGKNGVILVTNCWNDKFDVVHNNLMCISSKDTKLLNNIDGMKINGTASALCEKTLTR